MLLSVNYAPVTVSHQVVKFFAVFWRGGTESLFLLSPFRSKPSPAYLISPVLFSLPSNSGGFTLPSGHLLLS